ncbi:MAG TPA: hypothetical protein VF137_09035 [Candidatus Dormibacteraeota bacterium]
MKRSSRLAAGWGSIAFGVLTPVAIFVGGPMGGNYAASDVAAYISSGHVVVAGAMALLGLLGAAGLIALGAYLRQRAEAAGSGSIWPQTYWGLMLGSAICFAVSWGMFVSQPIGNNEAGTNLNIPPTITYAIGISGDEVVFESAATLLGFALILMAITNLPPLPGWLRWSALAVGVLGITSLAFFTFFPLLIWAIAMGVWLVAAKREPSVES